MRQLTASEAINDEVLHCAKCQSSAELTVWKECGRLFCTVKCLSCSRDCGVHIFPEGAISQWRYENDKQR